MLAVEWRQGVIEDKIRNGDTQFLSVITRRTEVNPGEDARVLYLPREPS